MFDPKNFQTKKKILTQFFFDQHFLKIYKMANHPVSRILPAERAEILVSENVA